MIRLFTTYYEEKRRDRRLEYEEVLKRNLSCAALDEVYIFHEGGMLSAYTDAKLKVVQCSRRPTYLSFFDAINRIAGPDDINVIANTDIFFDDGIRIFCFLEWRDNVCYALSRWDVRSDGRVKLFEHGDSQDAWIFKGYIRSVNSDFPLGVYDCDNKIAWELQRAGYTVVNPSLSIRSYHLHLSGYRSYKESIPPDYGIRPPFRYIEPDNIGNILKCWQYYRNLEMPYFPWRVTKRKIFRSPPVYFAWRVVNKIRRVLFNSRSSGSKAKDCRLGNSNTSDV